MNIISAEQPEFNESSGFRAAEGMSASVALEGIRARMPDIFKRTAQSIQDGLLPLLKWGHSEAKVQVLSTELAGKSWYFIGDLHNDFLAWHKLFARVRSDPDFRLCFLGDLVDRGVHHLECFAALMEAANDFPGQILWIVGNHDIGVSYRPKADVKFESNVHPAEFVDWLNDRSEEGASEIREAWGRVFVQVCARLPRAVLFPDGLLATHGGVPLEDRWATLKSIEALHEPRNLEDFTWTRIASGVPLRKGWKYDPRRREVSSAFDLGYRDLEGFSRAVENFFPVKRVVRGHDHVEGGAELAVGYDAVPVLTLNGFGFDYLTNSVRKYSPTVALGVHVPGELPRVENIEVSAVEHAEVYLTGHKAMNDEAAGS